MALTYRNGTFVTVNATSGTPTVPTGTVDGDLMFLSCGTTTDVINSIDASWTQIGLINNGSYYNYLYFKVADSEPASYTVGFNGSTKSTISITSFYGFNYDTTDPVDVVSQTPYIVSNTTNRAASMTVTNPDSAILWFSYLQVASVTTVTNPTVPFTMTEYQFAGTVFSDLFIAVKGGEWTGSGATGDMDGTISLGDLTDRKAAIAVAINPVTNAVKSVNGVSNV